MTPDPHFLAIVSADADEADRIYEQERFARHAPMVMTAEAALVPDALESPCSPAPEATMPPPASSPGAPRVGPPEAPDHAHPGLAAREASSPDDDPAGPALRPAGESGFRVPTCECGHVLGDHGSTWVPLASKPPGGICFRCDCRAFVERVA